MDWMSTVCARKRLLPLRKVRGKTEDKPELMLKGGSIMQLNVLSVLLEKTLMHDATDLHLCAGAYPLMRVNSRLEKIPDTHVLSAGEVQNIVFQSLDADQLAQLQRDRVIDFSYSMHGFGRFRCNFYKQRGTYAIAIRMLPLKIPPFETLHLPETILRFTKKNNGLILCTGSTGCGKSTTLASLIDIISRENDYHILTIEDPVEYLHTHQRSIVTQREIGEDATSFASALRSALRQDPDVIMVGEMRDGKRCPSCCPPRKQGILFSPRSIRSAR
jgi:twitching motility protein PilT